MDDRLYLLFFIMWGIYEVALCAVNATLAQENCPFDNDDVNKEECDGYGGAASMFFFSFVMCCASAWKYNDEGNLKYLFFAIALMFDAFGFGGWSGAASRAPCDAKSDSDDLTGLAEDVNTSNTRQCQGFGASCAFYIFAGFGFIALAVFLRPGQEKMTRFSFLSFWGSVSFYILGFFSFVATRSSASCPFDDDVPQKGCNGYGFAAFVAFCLWLGIFYFIYQAWVEQTKGNLWRGMITVLALYMFTTCVFQGTTADVYDSDNIKTNDGAKDGYGMATFFTILVTLIFGAMAIGWYFRPEMVEQHKHTAFFVAFILFYLSQVSVYGGQSKDGCDLDDNDVTKGTNKTTCDGNAMASFFMIVAACASAVATYFAYKDPTAGESSEEGQGEGGDTTEMPPSSYGQEEGGITKMPPSSYGGNIQEPVDPNDIQPTYEKGTGDV